MCNNRFSGVGNSLEFGSFLISSVCISTLISFNPVSLNVPPGRDAHSRLSRGEAT